MYREIDSVAPVAQACANPPDRHLDLGCGQSPRNPYGRSLLSGIDLCVPAVPPHYEHRTANLIVEPIPYPDDSFGSVSAFDFIEHVPRIFPDHNGGTRFPFVQLMDEVWRVLAHGGRFYALTPAYPHAEAFVDPTHVNFITEQTHRYFCGANPGGRMYGFQGRFEAVRVQRIERSAAYVVRAGAAVNHSPLQRLARTVRRWSRRLRGKTASVAPPYLLWELEAVKR
jgi:SAM-dependent methyltransferase